MASTEDERAQVLNAYKAKVREHREMESRWVRRSLARLSRGKTMRSEGGDEKIAWAFRWILTAGGCRWVRAG